MMSYSEQVQSYRNALLATGSSPLLEDTPHKDWGTSTGGKNWHGEISMKIRALLKAELEVMQQKPSKPDLLSNDQRKQGTNPLADTFIPGTYAAAVSYDAPLPPDLAKYLRGPANSTFSADTSKPPPPSYPTTLSDTLVFSDSMGKDINFDTNGCKVSVSALGGERTGPSVQRLKSVMSTSHFKEIVLHEGTNDVGYLSPDNFARNYSSLVQQAKSQGASVICSSIFYRGDGRSPHETHQMNKCIDDFNTAIRNICQVERCYYIDNNAYQSAWNPNFSQLKGRMGQKLHLTPIGANNFKGRVAKAIFSVRFGANMAKPTPATRPAAGHLPNKLMHPDNTQHSPFSTYNRFGPLSHPNEQYMYGAPQYQQHIPPLMKLHIPVAPGYQAYPPPMSHYRQYM